MLVIITGIIINILSILVLLTGLFHTFEHPKHKANFGYAVTASLFIYTVLLSIIAIYGLFILHNVLFSLILFLCVISSFVIGKLVKYETVKKYTAIQIICFLVSLFACIINVMHG